MCLYSRYLLARGARVNARDFMGNTAIILACDRYANKETLEMVKILAEHGADINAVNKAGNPAVGVAMMANRPDVMGLLIDLGATVDVSDNNGINFGQNISMA